MVIFHSYVSLPEGISQLVSHFSTCFPGESSRRALQHRSRSDQVTIFPSWPRRCRAWLPRSNWTRRWWAACWGNRTGQFPQGFGKHQDVKDLKHLSSISSTSHFFGEHILTFNFCEAIENMGDTDWFSFFWWLNNRSKDFFSAKTRRCTWRMEKNLEDRGTVVVSCSRKPSNQWLDK